MAHGVEIKAKTKAKEGNPGNFGKGGGTTFIIRSPIV